jgi:hypothetical protein
MYTAGISYAASGRVRQQIDIKFVLKPLRTRLPPPHKQIARNDPQCQVTRLKQSSPPPGRFTLRGSRHDSSSWLVRVQVSGKKLVRSTTEMILRSMILTFKPSLNVF